jgi:glucosamine 6-phosphate synthetase-like amidotransferase/phosphosugar isomerase protein
MNPTEFLADLEAKPAALERLAAALAAHDPFADVPRDVDRVLFLGMGSSRYAALDAAVDLRSAGITAIAEYASVESSFPPDGRTLVVAISASGESAETLHALEPYHHVSPILAITNVDDSTLAGTDGTVVDMLAGEERGGVTCRTFLHTALLLRALRAHLRGVPEDVAGLTRQVADATADLLDTTEAWLGEAAAALDGSEPVFLIGPADRLAAIEQGALMLREGPRRPAFGCETGDWAHVDVYLSTTFAYRALLFTGSRWDSQALEWLRIRMATVVAVGRPFDGAALTIRLPDDPDVARYTGILVPELVAARWWLG